MKPILLVVILLAILVSSSSLAQGHYEATAEKSIEIQRSSEYQVESEEFEKRVPVTLEYNTVACKADLRLEYLQKGLNAHVKTTLSNEECDASFGNYIVRIRYKDAQGEIDQVEFEETWIRNGDADVTSEKDYFVGDDIDIVRINTRRLSCSCKELETKEEEPDSSKLQ